MEICKMGSDDYGVYQCVSFWDHPHSIVIGGLHVYRGISLDLVFSKERESEFVGSRDFPWIVRHTSWNVFEIYSF